MDKEKLEKLAAQGYACVEKYSKKTIKASFLPFVSIPFVHGLCIAMISELNKIFGVDPAKGETPSNIALGVATTPFMAVPLLGAIVAASYVETVGKSYIKALIEEMESRR